MIKVIRITAIWCPSCIIMKNRYDDALKTIPCEVTDYDFDDDELLYQSYQIGTTLPVVIFEENGHELLRVIGEKSKKELHKLLEGLV